MYVCARYRKYCNTMYIVLHSTKACADLHLGKKGQSDVFLYIIAKFPHMLSMKIQTTCSKKLKKLLTNH